MSCLFASISKDAPDSLCLEANHILLYILNQVNEAQCRKETTKLHDLHIPKFIAPEAKI